VEGCVHDPTQGTTLEFAWRN